MKTRHLPAALALSAALPLAGCGSDADLTRALGAAAGREITAPAPPAAFEWTDLAAAAPGNDTLRFSPISLCMGRDRLVVADYARQRLLDFGPGGDLRGVIGRRGAMPGEFLELWLVRCSAESETVIAGDAAGVRLSFFGGGPAPRKTLDAPSTPQLPLLGDYAPLRAGRWASSWLGSDIPIGPYLSDADWREVRLLEVRDSAGAALRGLGAPAPYASTVARRVLNRTFLEPGRDTVWVLTQGDATVRGFDAGGRATAPIRLPVHFRGREPRVTVGERRGASEFRMNEMSYDPNVQDLAVVGDSLFATIRYRGWRWSLVGRGVDRSLERTARSAIEVFDRTGRVRRSLDVPGMAKEIATDGASRMAVLTELPDGSRRVLLGTVRAR